MNKFYFSEVQNLLFLIHSGSIEQLIATKDQFKKRKIKPKVLEIKFLEPYKNEPINISSSTCFVSAVSNDFIK